MIEFMEHVVKNRSMIMMFILMCASLAIIVTLLIAQFKKDSFDLRFLVVDDDTGKPSIHKAGQGIALIVSTWGFVYQIVHTQLTDTYLLVYVAAWAGSTAVNTYLVSRSGGINSSANNNNTYNSGSSSYSTPYRSPMSMQNSTQDVPIPVRPASNNNDSDDTPRTIRDDHPTVRAADKPLR